MIPIIINGNTCGELEFRRDGAYMIARGRADWSGELVRLWLCGSGEPVYLGVLQSDGSLRRRFSLGEFARLPKPLEYCADRPKAAEQTAPTKEEGEVLWLRQNDGSLVHHDGERSWVAFPTDSLRMPRGCRVLLREIEGETYAVFPW